MEAKINSSTSSKLFDYIKTKYWFLNEEEITTFINSHNWLISESDNLIVDDFLKQHYTSLYERHKLIVEYLQGNKPLPKPEKLEPLQEKIIVEEEENIYNLCLNELEKLYDHLVLNRKNKVLFWEMMEFLKTRLKWLVEKPNDESSHQIQWNQEDKFNDLRLINIFNAIGFQLIDLGDGTVLLIHSGEHKKQTLENIAETIDGLYLNNPQFMQQINPDQFDYDRTDAQFRARDNRHSDQSNFLASIHEQRLYKQPSGVYPIRGEVPNKQLKTQNITQSEGENPVSMRDQINEYRDRMRIRQMDDRKFVKNNVITMADIEKKRIEEEKVAFGKRALELTNEFRKQNKLPPVQWNQELCDIGMEHSKNMGDGKVPFGHQGFDKRCKMVTFGHKSMAENVAYSTGLSDPGKVAVDGWINSPGHRKNLLSASNVCGIAAYRNANGSWYFTQLFAYKY